jgi:hypothetical protein
VEHAVRITPCPRTPWRAHFRRPGPSVGPIRGIAATGTAPKSVITGAAIFSSPPLMTKSFTRQQRHARSEQEASSTGTATGLNRPGILLSLSIRSLWCLTANNGLNAFEAAHDVALPFAFGGGFRRCTLRVLQVLLADFFAGPASATQRSGTPAISCGTPSRLASTLARQNDIATTIPPPESVHWRPRTRLGAATIRPRRLSRRTCSASSWRTR